MNSIGLSWNQNKYCISNWSIESSSINSVSVSSRYFWMNIYFTQPHLSFDLDVSRQRGKEI